ncbi:MAG: aldo/keto reductase [Bacteroidota bacterium]
MMNKKKELVLGTAQWGWTIGREKAFEILEHWLNAGFCAVDCATNYPINREPACFRAAEGILSEFIQAHGLSNLNVTMKIGSMDNMRTPDNNLSPSFIQMIGHEYGRILGSNLGCLMIHWDNRDQEEEIETTLAGLRRVCAELNCRTGLSGVREPGVYARVTGTDTFDIQVKHNVLFSDLERYTPWFPSDSHRYYAYGINAGGIKLPGEAYSDTSTYIVRGGNPALTEEQSERISALTDRYHREQGAEISRMWQLGLTHAVSEPALHGIIAGISSVSQLQELVNWYVG